MFSSLKSKMLVPIIGVLVLMMVVIVAYVSLSVQTLVGDLTYERVAVASGAARARLDDFEIRTQITASAVAGSYGVTSALVNWNANNNRPQVRQNLIAYLTPMAADLGVDSFVIRDVEGRMVLRLHDLGSYNDFDGSPIGVAALQGQASTAYASTGTMPLGLTSTVPILHDGQIIGTFGALYFLYTDEFVDQFADALSAAVTIFGGYTRVATTVRNNAGARDIGTPASAIIQERVIEQGQALLLNVDLFGVPYYGYYIPLTGFAGNVVGMLFVGFSNAATFSAMRGMQYLVTTIGVVGILFAAAVVFWLVTRITTPIAKLANNLSEVSRGNLNVNINRNNISNDEVGKLTTDVINLVDVIRDIVDDLAKFEHTYNVDGDIEYRMDADKYENSFRDMVAGSNKLIDNVVSDVLGFLGTLSEVSEGNFNLTIKKLPGKKVVLEEAIRSTTKNMIAVNTEITAMIDAVAAKGDMSFQIDVGNYKGDWAKIMTGLNSITKAIDEPMQVIVASLREMAAGNFDLDSVDKKLAALGLNVDVSTYTGVFKDMGEGLNITLEEIASYINELEHVLAEMAQGNLRNHIDREYVGSFDLIKKSVNNINDRLNNAMSEIFAASDHVLSGAKQISSASMDLANGSSQQAASVEELNSSIELIRMLTEKNTDNAATATELSNKSTENAKTGNDAMKQMLQAMEEIKESSQGISKINKVIQDIAFQTNLLALNAAVEAARAGEHGKGFAVVAEEVRNLAARSQAAAQETTSLIEDSIKRVEAGSGSAESTAEALVHIVSNVQEVSEIISSVAASSVDQGDAAMQTTQGIIAIANVAQDNSASSEETAAAAEELNSQAEVLKQLVSFFKLK